MTVRVSDSALDGLEAIATHIGELKSDRVVAAFERQILSGQLAPGTRLPTESELCEILGVSRTVVRDSVRMLAARGLLTVRQGRGTEVAEPNDAAYTDALLVLLSRSELPMGAVMDARATLEVAVAAAAAVNGTHEDWAEMEVVYDTFAAAVAAKDEEAAIRWHAEFHNRILAAVHQPALELILKPMNEITLVSSAAAVRRSGREEWEVEPHRPILDALWAADPEAAARAVTAHFELSGRPPGYQAFLGRRFSDAYFSVTED